MGGGLMQLVAYGAQDIYLTGNPQITFFKVVYRRHTNFSMESIEQTFNGSADFGKTFENQMVKIQLVAAENKKTITGVRYMLVSPADSKRVMFVGNNNAHFLTKDGGATFELVNSLVPFEDIKLHPTDPGSILAAEDTCATKKAKECYRKLWMSKDFGKEWTFLAERVQQFDWFLSIPEDIRPVTWIGGSKNSFHRHQIIATIFRKSKN